MQTTAGCRLGITDAIVNCYDRGWLHRTSVIVNGAAWEYAVAALKQRPRLPVVLHLNIFEGRPISPPSEVDLLVDARGQFYRGFATLWARGLAGAGCLSPACPTSPGTSPANRAFPGSLRQARRRYPLTGTCTTMSSRLF